jgi:hypothetical protein
MILNNPELLEYSYRNRFPARRFLEAFDMVVLSNEARCVRVLA